MEKANRTSMKNLLVSVVSDIEKTYDFDGLAKLVEKDCERSPKEADALQKFIKVNMFLDEFLELMFTEVPQNWTRLQEYFEVWADLIR